LATSRSGNVTALSLLAPAPTASHGCHPTTPNPATAPFATRRYGRPTSLGRRIADRSTDGSQRSRNLHIVTPPALSSSPAATSRCTQPVSWARVDAVGVAPYTAGRSREDNGGLGGVIAIVVVAESQPSRPARSRPKSPLCCSRRLYQARDEPDDGRVVGGASTCARSGSRSQAHARGAAAPDLGPQVRHGPAQPSCAIMATLLAGPDGWAVRCGPRRMATGVCAGWSAAGPGRE